MSKATSRNLSGNALGSTKVLLGSDATSQQNAIFANSFDDFVQVWQDPQLYHAKHTKYVAANAEKKLNALVGVEVIPEFVAGQGPKD